MSNLADGNTAALRAYEAQQDRLDRQAPTDLELERYIDDWLERKCKKMGEMFLIEAFTEAADFSRIYKSYVEGDHVDLGMAFDKIVRAYWVPMAEESANGHNFQEDRK